MTPTQNERIRAAAWLAARGKLADLPREDGLCLKLVRVVIEAALQLPDRYVYDNWLVSGSSYRPGTDAERQAAAREGPRASDMEASAKRLGWGIPFHARQPGDLLFNFRALPPYGHVAVLLDRDTVLENVNHAFRPNSIHLPHSLALTPVEALPWTLAARVPPVEGGDTHSG